MRTHGSDITRILKINLKLAYAVFLIWLAYLCWPTSPEWWGFGFITICAGLAGFVLAIKSLGEVGQMMFRDRNIDNFNKSARQPHDDKLAGQRDIEKRGMLK